MADPNGPPRRVSMSYLLGFSDKPFKGPKQPPAPPRPRRPSQLTEMVTTPGGIIEWAASDGRKGRLTGTGKPRLTASALAKVPSEKRSTHEALAAKSASKHDAPDKPANDAENAWSPSAWDNTAVKNEAKHSGSKKAASKKEDALGTNNWGVVDSKNDASDNPDQWVFGACGNTWDTPVAADDKDNKKDNTTGGSPVTDAPVETALPEVAAAPVVEEKKADDSQSWTKEQDEKLMQLKTQNAVMKWTKIAEEVGKPDNECKKRFGEIKPIDWKPDNAKKGGAVGGGDGGGGKKKKKGNNGKDNRAAENEIVAPAATGGDEDGLFGGLAFGFGDDTTKGDSNKKEASGDNQVSFYASGGAGGCGKAGDAITWADIGGNGDSWGGPAGATGGADTSGEIAWDNGDTWGGNDQAGIQHGADNAITSNTWDNPGGGGVADQWPAPTKPASASRSNKAPSKAPSQSHSKGKDEVTPVEPAEPVSVRPATIELRPDDIFSADDLHLIARILQQDCVMVWNRVSWRFKDKTGRTLHSDVFEKKITGQVESKGSERGGRKK
ncbi:hypothetical protein PTNB85_08096 [Pyrenophora teres f. teres]|nr:hypothetical protein PTNB85_08096 [Pyrenophora teres f. teres]KAE8830069.1 hypothetical protein HRS9139_06693 [Pyrenophora teres f. teres]